MMPNPRAVEEWAEKIVEGLFIPNDPRRWGESPVSVEQLAQQIAEALRAYAQQQVEVEREACVKLVRPLHDPEECYCCRMVTDQAAAAIRART